jgi:hypothetical protein
VLTDIGILTFIPVPIIWRVKIPIRQKILVALLLCSGLFIITAAIIRCVSSIQDIRSINTAGVWAIRETFVTIIAINAPCIKPLFSARQAGKETRSGGFRLRNGVEETYGRSSDTGSQVKMVEQPTDEEMHARIKVTTMVDVHTHDVTSLVDVSTHDVRSHARKDTHTYIVAAGGRWEDDSS